MAIENTYLLGKNITLGCGFDLQAKAPLDSRQTVPSFAGLQALINYDAAYEGMIVYDEETKKTYQAQKCDPYTVEVDDKVKTYDITFREFGINESELRELIASETTAAMEFKGGTATLPENPAKGDMYKVTAEFAVGEETAKVGDSIVYNGEQWFLIPSGDDIEDTWRPVTDVNNDASLTFVAGDNLEVTVASTGEVTYKHEAIDAPTATPVGEDEQTRTYITSVETDGFGHIVGYKTATEVVEDTNTTYEFEGLPVGEDNVAPSNVYFQVTASDAEAAEVVYLDVYNKNEADGKFVAKEEGKSLISDDEIARLANVDNYDDEEIRGLIDAIDNHSHENKTVLDGITAEKVADWDDAVVKEHEHSFADADVEDAIAKKHAHTFVEAELNKIADGDVEKWAEAYAHSQVDHAPVNAQENIIESVKVNGTALEIKDKAVDITVPTGALAGKDEVAKDDLAEALATEIDNKVAKEDGKSLVLDTEITKLAGVSEGANKVEASENGKIKIDGVDTVVYTHPEKHSISEVDGLQDALDAKVAKADYEIDKATFATKTDLESYKTAADQKTIDDEQDRRLGELEGASATHATKDELNAVDGKFANYVLSESYTTDKQGIEEALANRYTKEEADGKFALIADAYDDTALQNRVKAIEDDYLKGEHKTALEGLITAEKERAEGIEGGLRTDVDAIKGDYLKAADKTELEGKITANANAITALTDGIDPEKIDGLTDLVNWANTHAPEVEGIKTDIEANTKAIGDEVARADAAEKALAGRLDTLEAIDHDAYVAADSALKTELEGAIADGDAATLEAAKKDASDKDVVVLSEAQKYADATKADAIADAANKYETKGTAQDIVDGLKLSETYEPIGAEGRAIAAAEGKVNTLAGEGNTSTVKKNADDIATLFEMFQWGEF